MVMFCYRVETRDQMKGNSSPATDEYNEDTDRANDSEDDQWGDNKLVIDFDSNMNNGENRTSNSTAINKEEVKSETFAVPDSKSTESAKPKGKRGAQKKADSNAKQEANKDATSKDNKAKQSKAEKEKPPPNKPGRKRKEKQTPKSSNGDVKSPLTDNNSNDPYKFEPAEEGVTATVTGKRSAKVNKRE